MTSTHPHFDESPLRPVLWANVGFTTISAAALLALGGVLAGWAAIPSWILRGVGAALVPFAVFVGAAARRRPFGAAQVRLIVSADAAWVVSAAVLILIPDTMSSGAKLALGIISAAVLVFGVLGWRGLGRLT